MPKNPQTLESDGLGIPQPQLARSLLVIAWQRKSLVALGVVVALVLGVLLYAQTTPVYQSKAQVMVVKKHPDDQTGVDTRHLLIEDYVAMHKALIESPLIVEQAIAKGKLQTLQCFAGEEELTEVIRRDLVVSRNRSSGVNTSNILDLSFRSTQPEEAAAVLHAIIDSYRAYLEKKFRNTSEDTLKLVTQARDGIHKHLLLQEASYSKFRKEAPLLTVRGKEGANLAQERLSSIEAKRSALLLRKAEVQGHLYAIESGLQKGGNRAALLAMVVEWTGKFESEGNRQSQSLTLQNQLFPLLQEEQKLLETKGARHPEVEAVRKRIDVARVYLASPSAPFRQASLQPVEPDLSASADPVEAYRSYFTQQLKHIEVSERLLADLFKQEYDVARALTSYELEDERYRNDISRSQRSFDDLSKRLQEIDLVKDVGGYDASAITPPTLGKKVQPNERLYLLVAVVVGSVAGLGLAYLAEITDRSFRSPEEVGRRLGLAVLGRIPYLKATDKKLQETLAHGRALDPLLCAYFRPKSVEAEAYRGVRTALYFSTQGQQHKVIQITSPNGGDGKSTMAANLAVSIAQSGKRVLLIDADLRKPRVHKIFGLTAKVGLASIIANDTEPREAILESGVPGLSIIPCGPLPPNPAELLTSPRFPSFLDAMREQFDLVIVDTPPILVVTDPCVVAPRVDGVLMTIRLARNGRPHAERAKDVLDTLGVNVLGVLVNDPDRRTQKAGYGYGYEYGYGYGYTEGYHNSEAEDQAKAGEAQAQNPESPVQDRPPV